MLKKPDQLENPEVPSAALGSSIDLPKRVYFKPGIPRKRIALKAISSIGEISFVIHRNKKSIKIPLEDLQPEGVTPEVKKDYLLSNDDVGAINLAYMKYTGEYSPKYSGEPPHKISDRVDMDATDRMPIKSAIKNTEKHGKESVLLDEVVGQLWFIKSLRKSIKHRRTADDLDNDFSQEVEKLARALLKKIKSQAEWSEAQEADLQHLLSLNGYQTIRV